MKTFNFHPFLSHSFLHFFSKVSVLLPSVVFILDCVPVASWVQTVSLLWRWWTMMTQYCVAVLESQKVHNIKDDHKNLYFVSNDSTGLSCFKVRFLTEINVPDQKKNVPGMFYSCFPDSNATWSA